MKNYYFYIMGNAHKHTVKIGLTTNIQRREKQIKINENLHLIASVTVNCSLVDALLMESLVRKAVNNQGLKHYGLDHFKATVEQYQTIRYTAKDILNRCIDAYESMEFKL